MNTTHIDGPTTDAWSALPWKQFHADVFRIQERIAQAATNGDRQKMHRLQRLLLDSFGARALSVKQVAARNRGRHTAGVDRVKSLTAAQCLSLAEDLDLEPTCVPVRRVWIPKKGKNEMRPLGIPTMRDRAQQALVKMTLEPEWETRFEPNSYGFRPKRSCADAIAAVFNGISHSPTGKFVLDADIKACFDRIDHGALLRKLGTIAPIHRLVRAWLRAGILDGDQLHQANATGTPQGGVISPLLCNVALHGIETAVLKEAQSPHPPMLVRYADDFVILHKERAVIEAARESVERFLLPIGLELNMVKTAVRHTVHAFEHDEGSGFDFLGFHVRCHPVSLRQKPSGDTQFITLVTPSKAAVRRHYESLCEIIDHCRAADQATLIRRLNTVIRGWANYYRCCNAAETFGKLRHLLFRKLWRWAYRRHSRKAKRWIVRSYWNDGAPWIFRDRETGLELFQHSEVSIRRHIKVRQTAHVFDRDRPYWATRQAQARPKKTRSPGLPVVASVESIQTDGFVVDLW